MSASRVSDNLRRLAAKFPQAAAIALNEIAETTVTDAKEHTPVQYGTLRASGHVSETATPDDLSVTLAFGTSYAVFVHENLNAHHDVGEAKFLEHAVQRTAVSFPERMAAEMKSILGE